MRNILVIAGEASGDLHAANLVREVMKRDPTIAFYGVGSRRLAEAGVKLIADAAEISVVGATEVLTHIREIYGVYSRLKEFLRRERPDLLILIDFPDFNIMVGRYAKKLGIPVLYYISPQVWAWRKGRVKKIAELVKAMMVVFPFEVDIYRKAGVDVRYVGHPLTDVVKSDLTREGARASLGLATDRTTVALLPGSRKKEIANLLPDMLSAAEILGGRFPGIQFVLPVAHTLPAGLVEGYAKDRAISLRIVDGRVYDVLRASDAAIVTSGTATLETGLMGVPMVIVYRMSGLSFFIARLIIDVPHVGLVNIVADKRVVPELLQGEVTPSRIADEISIILKDKDVYSRMQQDLLSVRARLGDGGASARAAEVVMEMIGRRNSKLQNPNHK